MKNWNATHAEIDEKKIALGSTALSSLLSSASNNMAPCSSSVVSGGHLLLF
jgi:hypothetical protein